LTAPLLSTKFYIPPTRPEFVPRPRLIARLDEGLQRKLTLVSAPAGFGKTALVSAWVADRRQPAAWLSLDEADNDPARFLAYFTAALERLAPAIGEKLAGMRQAAQPPPTEAILTALLNEIGALADRIVLVLDDYHLIDSAPIDQALAFLLEHQPPQLHLVIVTRQDPDLPLARLRARGQLTELRAADLRFAPGEAATFLNQVMGLDLSAEQVAALEARTEGWIAGLQLAALSMRGRSDVAGFIRAFAGDNRYIVDYLVEEVLQRQPERVGRFLLQTSILDRLSGPLCDAITEQAGSQSLLQRLERGNLFVIPLDDRRQWYRYHHLFADVLRARLMEEQPGQASELHRRASEWFGHNALLSEAVHHALLAADFAHAASLVEQAARDMLTSRQDDQFLAWLKALPDELFDTRPVLNVYYALALVLTDLPAAESRLRAAEKLLAIAARGPERPEAEAIEIVVVDQGAFRSLAGMIAITRAYIAGALGDVPGSVNHARRARDLLPEDDALWRGAAEALLGLAYWTNGDLEAAYRAFADGTAAAGDLTQSINNALILANIRTAQGRLREAARIYEQSLALAAGQGEPMPMPAADLYVGISELQRERNDLEGASQWLARSKALSEHGWISEYRHRWYVAMAGIQAAQGVLDGALDLLDEAARRSIPSPDPDVRPIAALRARLWIRQGRLADALEWVRERKLGSDDELSYLREFEHLTFARVLMARYQHDRDDSHLHQAIALLERLLQAAEAGWRMGSVIEILVLLALAHQAQGRVAPALAPLARALALAEPEGYVRTFVDEGQPMAALLAAIEGSDNRSRLEAYIHTLLTAIQTDQAVSPVGASTPHDSTVAQPSVEPLSERELEVLKLLKTDSSGPEIARQLMVSLNTLRTHTKSIYRKLGVSSRRAAVSRAEELNLL
jgi:LuxR family transcriptional regulator, maltose regulon positive regulatory protein